MSHELRTPLNSLLILAKLLAENTDGNLNDKQIEFASTIHQAGADLLELINDILDLSKVEAGKMDVQTADVRLGDVRDYVERTFKPLAEDRGLELTVEISGANVPPAIVTDEQRLQQVLKNLLSNAVKFTEQGGVTMRIEIAPADTHFLLPTLASAESVVAFSVSDTGIGIPEDKLRLIFEAFQQADGTTSRKYGGTGLGLSISREIARLLGGEIRVRSEPGKGSTFTLYLPTTYVAQELGAGEMGLLEERLDDLVREGEALVAEGTLLLEPPPSFDLDPALLLPSDVDDDRDDVQPGDRVVLIVEDDAPFARTVLEMARERGFKGIVALRGDAGLALAHEFKPDAIVLDMDLPVMDGWTRARPPQAPPCDAAHPGAHRLRIVRRRDERPPRRRRRVPREADREGERSTRCSRRSPRSSTGGVRSLLIVEDDDDQRNAIVELVGGGDDVEVTAVGSSDEALAELGARAVRLHGARPQAARDVGLQAAREAEEGRAPLEAAGDRLHGQGADAARGDAPQEVRRDDHRQGRPLAGAAARRDVALPASRRGAAAAGEAPHARAAAQRRGGLQRARRC